MRFFVIIAFVAIFINAALFAQDSSAVITGVVMDSEGTAIADVKVEAENLDTGVRYVTTGTSTGNYVFPDLAPGRYQIAAAPAGYEGYLHKDVAAFAAQVTREDIVLVPVETAAEEETAEEETPEGEAAEEFESPWSDSSQTIHDIKADTLRNAPLLGFATGEARIRNPLNVLRLTPGSLMTNLEYFRVNGAPSNTETIRIEGQDVNNGMMLSSTILNQVGVDAVEEFAIQTGNYPAEFGQAGGGIVNIATKSGTNAFHGSAYEYWANEVLNTNQPFTNLKPRDRRNNYGVTLGGPVSFPGKQNGNKRTFFFLNFEQFRQLNIYEQAFTVPTLAYRIGDFRKALTGRRLGTDPLGRAIMEGTIYDPATERMISGKRVRDPFASNIIQPIRFDAVALRIQGLIPEPTIRDNNQVVDNYLVPWRSPRLDTLGSFKVDHNFSNSKLSVYYSINDVNASQSLDQGGDGLTSAITSSKPTDVRANALLIGYDRALAPTRVLHVGFGYQWMRMRQASASGAFDQEGEIGLTGSTFPSFPYIAGLLATRGGMKDMGANMQALSKMRKPSGNVSLSWIRKSHSYKFGAEVRFENYPTVVEYPAYGSLTFSADQTSQPSTLGQNLQGGTIGFPYASFLLGLVGRGDIGVVSEPELGKHAFAFFAQDSWKIAPKLTFEYGLRYDYQTYLKEAQGRVANFSPTTLNPSAGNLPGALIFEGSGAGHCDCDFAKVYPYAFAPRLGLAYHIFPSLVVRGGMSVVYGQTPADNGTTLSSGSTNPFFSTSFDNAALKLSNGFPDAGEWPNFSPGQTLLGSGVSPMAIDSRAGRPPRQVQWSLGVQYEFATDLILDLAYVGNRGAWWESNGLVNLNAISIDQLESKGLDITLSTDRTLLTSTLNSSLAAQRRFSTPPYAGFPLSQTVAQSLRPFPQFGDIFSRWAPLGKTWYDALQVKLTKRYSHGLDLVAGFTFQKEMAAGAENVGGSTPLEAVSDVFDPKANKHISALSRPYVGYVAPSFQLPRWKGNKWISSALSDWRITGFFQYGSGLPIRVPVSNNGLYSLIFQNTWANRKKGADLYTEKLDSGKIDPMKNFALNPDAWRDPGAGEFSSSAAYFTDYRFQRRPLEQISLGRSFKLKDTVRLSLRADFQNIFNRVQMADPDFTNAGATQVKDDNHVPQSGFGFINYKVVAAKPRNGMIVLKLEF